MINQDALVAEYADKIAPILPEAKKAYGSRATNSPQHAASRKYTQLLVEFYGKGGSLLKLADALHVTYPGMRRRVMTAQLKPSPRRTIPTLPQSVYDEALNRLRRARDVGTESYHKQIKSEYDHGISLTRMAQEMGLSSANPLYYGLSKATIDEQQEAGARGK